MPTADTDDDAEHQRHARGAAADHQRPLPHATSEAAG